ncbi:hypothetical protein GWR56_13050 [Mucilaginibacter sp. 14171R-50]|uniref:hypothetical protein n=1 Tax=Mucilaginibacter sp. 14171R-50 TaxID=2703789 RepID=UPI00138CB0B8|nr:hypothetical protein [Mucilaginibacter sp. 14171R-50]QHS56418.1 hypothetical protein GWR56_13050 [Mucilaginibacter sp. 14171R-50]
MHLIQIISLAKQGAKMATQGVAARQFKFDNEVVLTTCRFGFRFFSCAFIVPIFIVYQGCVLCATEAF